MTRLPWDSWQVKARLDLPAYELNKSCAISGKTWGLEDHHIWRRSFGAEYREAWWVELEDGRVVPNRINLNREEHQMVTENKWRILLLDTEAGLEFWWAIGDEPVEPLDPQPAQGIASDLHTPADTEDSGGDAVQPDHEHETEDELEECSTCNGTGKRKRRRKRRPSNRKRVISTRLPASEQNAYDTLTTLNDACEEILVQLELLKERGAGAGYYRDVHVKSYFVQNHKELLSEEWKKGHALEGEGDDEE